MTDFMGVVIACLQAAGKNPGWIKRLADELERIAIEHPDLVERYDKALAARDAKEMERIWFQCSRVLGTSLRINGVTGRLHFGHSSQSLPLFPRVFQILPLKGAE